MASGNSTVYVVMTPFGEVHEKDMTPDEIAALSLAVRRKNGIDLDMRHARSKKAQRVIEAMTSRVGVEWTSERDRGSRRA